MHTSNSSRRIAPGADKARRTPDGNAKSGSYVRAISASTLATILDPAPHAEPEVVRAQRRYRQPPPSWTSIFIAVAAVVALWLFLFALDAGMLK